MENTGFKDVNNDEILNGDIILYTDPEHNILNSRGIVRKNLAGIWEVINEDKQSGNDLEFLMEIKKIWQ